MTPNLEIFFKSILNRLLGIDFASKTYQINGLQKVQIVDANSLSAQVSARTQTPTGNALQVQIGAGDIISNLPVVVDYEHHQVHEGETYKVFNKQASLGTSTVKYALVVGNLTATTRTPHLKISTHAYNGSVEVDLYEGSTYGSGGGITSYNRNRNSSNVPNMSISGGVLSTDGTLIESIFVGSGSKSGGESRGSVEWDLKPNTTYRVDLIGLTASTQAIIHFDWYEDLGV